MRVGNIRGESQNGRYRISAEVEWEECPRSRETLYFEVADEYKSAMTPNPHAFLLASAVPALHFGERRLVLDGAVCPELLSGLQSALEWLRHWYYGDRPPLALECKTMEAPHAVGAERSAAFFYSGGVDSLATLRGNQLRVPVSHPHRITDGLLVYGLELDEPRSFDYVIDSLSRLAREAHISLVPVFTNIYLRFRPEDSEKQFTFWRQSYEGAALSAVAHALNRRIHAASIGSTFDIANMAPLGSHPLLDSNYSSSDVRIRHDGVTLSRLQKTRLVAEWPAALDHLRVCNQYKRYDAQQLNCGRCEKCIRTMLGLLVINRLSESKAFAASDVCADLVRRHVTIRNGYGRACYQELLEPLRRMGRTDLVAAVSDRLRAFDGRQRFLSLRRIRQYLLARVRPRAFGHLRALPSRPTVPGTGKDGA